MGWVVVVDWLRLLFRREKPEAGAAVLGVAVEVDCPPRVDPKPEDAKGDGRDACAPGPESKRLRLPDWSAVGAEKSEPVDAG